MNRRERRQGTIRNPGKDIKLPAIYRWTKDRDDELKAIPYQYLQKVIDGNGDEHAWITLVLRVATARGLTSQLTEDSRAQALAIYMPALRSLLSVGERYQRLGRFGFNGDELQDVQEAFATADAMQDLLTRREARDNYREVTKIIGGFNFTMKNLRAICEGEEPMV